MSSSNKDKSFVVFDSFSTGCFHETYNSAFLLALTTTGGSSIHYYADKSSIEALKNKISKHGLLNEIKKVKFFKFNLIKGVGSLSKFLRFFFGAFMNIYACIFTSKNRILIITIANPFFLIVSNILFFLPKRNIFVICHGELELVVTKKAFYKPSFTYKVLINCFFRYFKINKNLKFIVLNETVKEEFCKRYPDKIKRHFVTLAHPYIFESHNSARENESSKRLALGTIGVMSYDKGLSNLIKLSEKLKDFDPSIVINVVGFCVEGPIKCENVKFLSYDKTPLSTEIYNKELEGLDFVLFLYDKHSYKLKGSGAIFDVINKNKPILAIRNQYFEYIFKKVGPIGYLCEDVEEVFQRIKKIKNNKNENYQLFYENIQKAKKEHNYDTIGSQIKSIF